MKKRRFVVFFVKLFLPIFMNFKQKVVIITGAGQGIGLEIARQLAAQGAAVLLNDIDDTLAHKAVEQITAQGGICAACVGDISDVEFCQTIVNEAVKKFNQIDILIANAGVTLFGDFFDYEPAAFERVVAVNLRGTFFLTQAATRQMRAQQTCGRVLLMSSVTAHQAHQYLAAYSMTKAAIEMLAKNLVIELSPHNITINTVAPGATMTERTAEDLDYFKTWAAITPLSRPATVQDIADAVLFLVSSQARHITGQSLIVDGGWTAISPTPY
jgi:glucose 1-dehydrogenase